MIDYQNIIENLKDEQVKNLLIELGADVIEKDNCLICSTICHNEDAEQASKKLYYYKDTHLFYCYTECGGMNIFKFLRNYYETRNIEYDWYTDIFQVVLNCSASSLIRKNPNIYQSQRSDYEPQKNRKKLPTYPIGLLDCFVKRYPIEWLEDHIAREAMDKYDIRYSISQNKIIIPHFDVDGDLIGIRGRALNQWEVENVGKYMPVQIENKWYSHPLSLNLYGLNFNKKEIKKYGIAYIFESEKSCLQFESFNLPHCAVASCGSNVNKYQIDLLMRYCQPREIVICYDNEELEGEDKYFQKLWKMCEKYKNYCNMSFIYDRKGLSKLKDSPSDNGEEIFAQLLKERIKI
jgi:hypothetical protein